MNVEIYKGINFFTDGEEIFINRAEESVEQHLHSHDYIEIAYVAEGEGIHIIDGNKFNVSKGDLFLIDYDISHEFRSLSDVNQKLIVYNCIFRPKFIDQNLINSCNFFDIAQGFLFNSLLDEGNFGNNMKILGSNDIEIGELYIKMYREYQNKAFGYIEILRAYLIELIIKVFRLNKERTANYVNDRDKRYFDDVIRFMRQNYNEDIRLDDLAAIAFLSRNYFCRRFKECTGVTVLEHLQNLRIEEACKLLHTTTKQVSEIAEAVGYSDIKFFNRLFKKIVKKSPSDYRRSINSKYE